MATSIKSIKNRLMGNASARKHANYFFPGSILDSFAGDVAELVYKAQTNQERIISAIHVDTAMDSDLDRLANDFNISRRLEGIAYSSITDNNVTISTMNGQSLIEVLAEYNISILGLEVANSSMSKRYVINATNPVEPGMTSVNVAIRSLVSGDAYNLARNEITRIVGTYPKLKVTNNFAIRSAEGLELDTSLRLRILNKIESNMATRLSLEYYLSSEVPNYGRSTIEAIGPGVSIIYLQPARGLFFENKQLTAVRTGLLEYFGPSHVYIVKNYNPVLFNIETRIVITDGSNITTVSETIKGNIKSYFDGLAGGDSVDLGFLQNAVMMTPGVKVISSTGSNFKKVTYTRQEGSVSFELVAKPGETILVNRNEIATINIADISISNE